MPNAFKKLCEMFLSLLCSQPGGHQGRGASTDPEPQHWALIPCVLVECLCEAKRSSGVTSSLKRRFPDSSFRAWVCWSHILNDYRIWMQFLWFNTQHALLRLGPIISIYSQKPGELFVKRQSNKSSTVCKTQTFVLQVKYLDRNHYWVLLQQPCQRKREGWERKHKGDNNIWLAKQLENWWGIVKPIKASRLSVWVTSCSRKQLLTEELLLNITPRTCLLLVTLQYPLLELCVSENLVTCLQGLIDNSCHTTSWVRVIPSTAPEKSVAVCSGWIFHSCPVSFCAFLRLRLSQWPVRVPFLCSLDWYSSIFWMQCPV